MRVYNQKNILRLIHRVEDSVLVIVVCAIIVLAVLQIILRNMFGSGITWIVPLLSVLVLWVSLLGALVATRQYSHIKINVLNHYIPERFQLLVLAVNNIFAATIVGIVAYFSVEFLKLELESSVKAFAGVPVWISELILPIAFSLMAIRFLLHAVINLIDFLRYQKR